jgi:hemoglobin-like flavoprotein
MTSTDKMHVRSTFALVAPMAEPVAAMFYRRLFEADASLRALFKTDMQEQGRKLMQMIGFCVSKLDALDELLPSVMALGAKHAGYGVQAAHYDTVGGALLWTLEQGLGPRFTADVKSAWTVVYTALANAMIAGSQATATATPSA